jgi:transposase InsO family protein
VQLRHLGHEVGRNTIKRILLDAGMDPAPERSKRTSWSAFLRAHWEAIAAMDFFTVEVLTLAGLVRYHVLFVIDLASRRVEVCGISRDPSGEWMKQMARNLTDPFDGFLLRHRYLIMDRDPLFTRDFRAMVARSGVASVRLPARSPNLNAFAERFVRSIKSECLGRVIPLGRRHLWQLVGEYVRHYHIERSHQGLENRLIAPVVEGGGRGPVRCRKRLGRASELLSSRRCVARKFLLIDCPSREDPHDGLGVHDDHDLGVPDRDLAVHDVAFSVSPVAIWRSTMLPSWRRRLHAARGSTANRLNWRTLLADRVSAHYGLRSRDDGLIT